MQIRHVPSIIVFVLFLTPAFGQRVITTVAGTDWLFPGDGRPAINAPLGGGSQGLDVAVDHNGNYFICDRDNFMVMRVGPDGIVNVIAGNGVNFATGDGGLAVNAGLLFPVAIAVDSIGNVYIAELSDVRKVGPDGIITTIAGNGNTSGFSGDHGLATQALLYGPHGLAVDSAGNLYIADTYNNRIRKVSPDGIITTVAGNGQVGYSGDNGPATSAQINSPYRIALDSSSNLYIAASLDDRVLKVDARGTIATVAGGGSAPGDGIPATTAFMIPSAVAIDASGNLYIAETVTKGIRRVDTQGRLATIAGGSGVAGFSGDGGPALNARFSFNLLPALAIDADGNILVGDQLNQRIRKITSGGVIDTIAGNGLYRFSGNGGPATSAALDNPTSVVADNAGNIYITEPPLSRIRRVTPDGIIDVFAGNGTNGYSGDNGPALSASLNTPQYLAFDRNGSLYFSDFGLVRKIDTNGIVTTYAGTGNLGASGDGGPPTQAMMRFPQGIDFDGAGELIIADSQDNRLRIVFPDATLVSTVCKGAGPCILTLAGDGKPGFSGDNGVSPRAEVNNPVGVRVYNGSIYFADAGNNRIRRINLADLIVTTVAGNGQPGNSGDGGPAIDASLNNPQSVAFDAAGNMYIADTNNSVVRRVTPDGIIGTFVGVAKKLIQGDGGPVSAAGVAGPTDVFVDSTGRVLIADFFLGRIRAVLTSLPSFQVNPANLAFTVPAGSNPSGQLLDFAGSIPGVPFSVAATSSGWLTVAPSSGTMPVRVSVAVDPSSLSPGPYQGTVTITAPNAQPSTQTIPVALTVTGAGQPTLAIKPASLTFSYVLQSPANSRAVSVSNIGGGSLAFNAVTATTSGGAWLSASPAGGTVKAFGSTPVNITADPSGVGPGTYSGTVTLSSASPAQSVVVPVTMTVTAVQQTILIPQTGLTFFAVQGSGPTAPQFFNILNTGRGQMRWSVKASTFSGGSWLSDFPGTGVSDAQSPVVPVIRLDVNPQGLQAGTYAGTVQVNAPEADNTPQSVSVFLNVLPPGSNIGAVVQPSAMIFSALAGGGSPGSQNVIVQSLSSTPVTFTSASVTADGGNWITALPPSGAITSAQPARIVIQPRTDGLGAGIYRGSLTLSFSDGNTRSIAIVLVLVPSGSSGSSSSSLRQAQAACTPKTLAPVFTLQSEGFQVPAGFPNAVAVKVIDDCANLMTSGNVVVSFSNGDVPLRLDSLKDGNWSQTWTPQHNTSSVTITSDAEIPEQMLTGEAVIKGGFLTFDTPPVVSTDAIVNGASFVLESPVAPGSLISIFGSKLAVGQAAASTTPLPVSLAGTSVLFAGIASPLSFAGDGQINAMVPFEITVNSTQQVIVNRGNSPSAPQSVKVAAAAPGVFSYGSGRGIIVNAATNALTDPTHPVKAGDVLTIYCTGLGQVNPTVATGSPAPLSPLSNTVNAVTVSIGGVSSNVFFAGLAPLYVGVNQVNALVPAGVAPGDQVQVVLTAAGQQSQPVTISVR